MKFDANINTALVLLDRAIEELKDQNLEILGDLTDAKEALLEHVKKAQATADPAEAIMGFAEMIAGALDNGFVETPHLTVGELYQAASNHVSDHYNHKAKTLAEIFDIDFADYACGI